MKTTVYGAKITIVEADGTGVAERFATQYEGREGAAFATHRATAERLPSIDPADYEAIAKEIGNKSWTHPYCDCCGKYVLKAWEVGEYDAKKACLECTKLALARLEAT